MQLENSFVPTLEEHVRSLVNAQSPSDIFKILLKGIQTAAPRGAVFLLRQGSIKGWGSIGYDSTVARNQRAFRSPADQGRLGELVQDSNAPMQLRSAAGGDPDFGQAAACDSAAIAVRAKGRTIAVLLIERSEGESLWLPATLPLLVSVAQLRLELDLALRRLSSESTAVTAPPAPATVAPANVEPTVAVDVPPIDVVPLGASQTTEVEVAPTDAPGTEDADVVAARRFAKLVATDIRLYNEEAVMLGRREGDLVERLGDQLGRGKETFLRRHGEMGSAAVEILHEAFVEVLAAGDKSLLPAAVLD